MYVYAKAAICNLMEMRKQEEVTDTFWKNEMLDSAAAKKSNIYRII